MFFTDELQIDYAKFAAKGGFANANSAKAVWHGLKKKLAKASGNGDAGTSNSGLQPGED